jgi:flavin reductase (DIM6/NTAB) family NADH-FMN oxidoreductase RutF
MNLAAGLKLLARPLPLWLPIALPEPQSLIDVRLEHAGGDSDVTENHVIVSLLPFTIGIGGGRRHEARLRFFDRVSGAKLGTLVLTAAGEIPAGSCMLTLYGVAASSHSCLAQPLRAWNRVLQDRAQRKNSAAGNFRMSPAAIEQMQIFYLCPRPVTLVSVGTSESGNLFPMDLIGPVTGGFTLALRNSSPSVATLRDTRRAALSTVPAADRDLAYELGKHHRQSHIDWSALPFALTRSPNFGLPMPENSVRVRECEIDVVREIGSHTLFHCRVISDEARSTDPRLFHTSGLHAYFRARQARVLPWSEAGVPRCS